MVHIAAITPRGGHGEIDVGGTFDLIDYLGSALRGHKGGIVLFDAVGEYPAFPIGDRSRVFYLAAKRSRVPILAGVGSATLDGSVELAREARDAGAAAVLLPPPLFFSYEQDEIREFYLRFAEISPIKAYLEHLPGSVTGIEVGTARELLATGCFAGVVDSTGEHLAAGLPAFLANDAAFQEWGAECALSAAACAVPQLVLALDCARQNGNSPEAARLNGRFREFLQWTREIPMAALLRTAVASRGIRVGPPATPLPARKQQRLNEFREWFSRWN